MSNDQRPQRMKIVAGTVPMPRRRASDRVDPGDADDTLTAADADAAAGESLAATRANADADAESNIVTETAPARLLSPFTMTLFLVAALAGALAMSILPRLLR